MERQELCISYTAAVYVGALDIPEQELGAGGSGAPSACKSKLHLRCDRDLFASSLLLHFESHFEKLGGYTAFSTHDSHSVKLLKTLVINPLPYPPRSASNSSSRPDRDLRDRSIVP